MTLKECMFINNSCYIKNEKMNNNKPTGIVVHSTGANNKTLKRYVQPVSGQSYFDAVIADIGKNQYGNHWNQSAEAMKRSVCVHAFIGANAAGKVETYQVLPFDVCCWGVGSGKNGSYNYNPQARVQFEMCEDGLTDAAYFNAVMKEAQEFCAFLCKKYGFGVDKISSHHESYLQGYGGNHGDPENWLKPFGKTMDWFRSEVQKLLDIENAPEKPASGVLYRVQVGAYSVRANADAQLAKVKAAGFDTYMVQVGGLFKIQVGAYSVKSNADNMLNKLKAAGFDGFITTTSGTAVGSGTPAAPAVVSLSVGDKVKMTVNAPVYGKTGTFASWVYASTLYVREINGSRIVISTQRTGAITGAVDKKYLTKI